MSYQAQCMICYGPCIYESVWRVHCLFRDDLYVGRPICNGCYDILEPLIPDSLDVIRKQSGELSMPNHWKECKACNLYFPIIIKGLCRFCRSIGKKVPKKPYEGITKWM